MRSLLYKTVKPVVARALGECATAERVLAFTNESQERLLNRPNEPLGSAVRYRFCTSNACITFPRQVRTVLMWAYSCGAGRVVPEWYEFLGNGPGQQDEDACLGGTMIDHGTVPAFQEVDGTGKYIRVYAQNAADAGKKVILKFYRDDTKTKQYTLYGGAVQEGEELTLVAPPNYAVTAATVMKGGLYGVIKDVTNYPINLYEYDGAANSATLAQYEPSETNPIYRRYMVPGLANYGGSGTDCAGEACDQPTITAFVRLQHVPVVLDNDPLVLNNIAAIKLGTMAILAEEQHRRVESRDLWAMANTELEGELASYQGAGMSVTINVADRFTWGGGGISSVL